MSQNRMYNLDGRKGEGLLIMGKNWTQRALCGTKKYIQRSSLTRQTMWMKAMGNFVAGFQRGHDKAVRYIHQKGLVHYQRTTLVQKLPPYYLETFCNFSSYWFGFHLLQYITSSN